MGGQISSDEFGRVIVNIDKKLSEISKNQTSALKYSMQNEQRIAENEFQTQAVAEENKKTDGRIDDYDKLFLRIAIAIVLSFGGSGVGIYAFIANQTNPPAENHTPKTELKTVSSEQ